MYEDNSDEIKYKIITRLSIYSFILKIIFICTNLTLMVLCTYDIQTLCMLTSYAIIIWFLDSYYLYEERKVRNYTNNNLKNALLHHANWLLYVQTIIIYCIIALTL